MAGASPWVAPDNVSFDGRQWKGLPGLDPARRVLRVLLYALETSVMRVLGLEAIHRGLRAANKAVRC